MMTQPVTISETDRQAVLLSIARLAIERPDWDEMLGGVAERFAGREVFAEFKKIHAGGETFDPGDVVQVVAPDQIPLPGLALAVGSTHDGEVIVEFGQPRAFLLMSPEAARRLAGSLLRHADEIDGAPGLRG
ncbi:MAG: hypothetical protein LC745_02120 [Planctomycetia bacterium]|nr:hypothetical protein [Planctomycetia bacterium]